VSLESIRGAILVLMLLAATPILAEDNQIVGVASVDGDTVEIHGQRIRLFDIDALIFERS
jgi:endonuclease YncB( thermonuclease family)